MTRSASAAPTTPARRSSKLRLLDSLRDLDLPLEDLAGRPLGQLVDEPDLARVLVARDLLLDVLAQLVLGDVLALLERHGGRDLLAELVVRDTQDGGLADGRVLVENL